MTGKELIVSLLACLTFWGLVFAGVLPELPLVIMFLCSVCLYAFMLIMPLRAVFRTGLTEKEKAATLAVIAALPLLLCTATGLWQWFWHHDATGWMLGWLLIFLLAPFALVAMRGKP